VGHSPLADLTFAARRPAGMGGRREAWMWRDGRMGEAANGFCALTERLQ